MEKEQTTPCLVEIWGNSTFCKIYPVLNINKIKFSFAEKSKPKEGIDIWLDVDDFISDFIDIINTGELRKLLYAEKKRFTEAKKQYGEDVWKSRAGKASNGDIRRFTIQPGMKTEVVIRATQDKKSITVGFDYRELKLLALRWSYLFKDYESQFAAEFTVEKMTSTYYNDDESSKNQTNSHKTTASPSNQRKESNNTVQKNTSNEKPSTGGNNGVTVNQTPAYSVSGKADAPVTTETASNNKESSGNNNNNISPTKIRLKTTSELKNLKDGCMGFTAITEDNIDVNVYINKNTVAATEPAAWNAFSNRCSTSGVFVTVVGVQQENKVYVKSVA